MKSAAEKFHQNEERKERSVLKRYLTDRSGLWNLFLHELTNIYNAEKTLAKSIPAMIHNTNADKLVALLIEMLGICKEHVMRLEKVFLLMGKKIPENEINDIESLSLSAEEIMKLTDDKIIRDAFMILAGLKIQSYKITSYAKLSSSAKTLSENEAQAILYKALNQEMDMDEKFSEIAEFFIVVAALGDEEIGENKGNEESALSKLSSNHN